MHTRQTTQNTSSSLVGSTFQRAYNASENTANESIKAFWEGFEERSTKVYAAKDAIEKRIQEGFEKQGKAFEGVANLFKGTSKNIENIFNAAKQGVVGEIGLGVDYIRKQAGYKAAFDVLQRELVINEVAGGLPTISKEERQKISELVRQDAAAITAHYTEKLQDLNIRNSDPEFQRTEFRQLMAETIKDSIHELTKLTANLKGTKAAVVHANRLHNNVSVEEVYESIKNASVRAGVDTPQYIKSIAGITSPTSNITVPQADAALDVELIKLNTLEAVPGAIANQRPVVAVTDQESVGKVQQILLHARVVDMQQIIEYIAKTSDNKDLHVGLQRGKKAELLEALSQQDRIEFLAQHVDLLPQTVQQYAAKKIAESKIVEKINE